MPEFFGSAKALPFRKLPFHHSLIAIRYSPFAVYYSLLATRYSPSFWLGRSLTLPTPNEFGAQENPSSTTG
jgi:hypothetical protein